tara:strand:+ start:551 stop:733 length:183 start_codon:yes stop_codon:yes gene_type:complete
MKLNKISTLLLSAFLPLIMMGSAHADFNDGGMPIQMVTLKQPLRNGSHLLKKGMLRHNQI